MQQEILDTLFGDRDVLTDLIIKLSPANTAQQKQLQDLIVRRDRLSMVIQDVINSDIASSTKGITAAVKQLDDASAKLAALGKTFDDIASAIELTDQVVNVVAAVVSVVAA